MMFIIEEIPQSKIAYMRRVGAYGAENSLLMEKLKSWAGANDLMRDDAVILAIAQDNPAITAPQECRYDVCIVVNEDYEIASAQVMQALLPGGKYAVFTVGHTAQEIQRAWGEIFALTLSQGFEIDESRPILERYIPAMVNKHLCEICVPVC